MKKKELIKEIDRLNKVNLELRNDLSIMLSEDKTFDDVLMVRIRYQTSNGTNYVMWRGDKNGNVKQFN